MKTFLILSLSVFLLSSCQWIASDDSYRPQAALLTQKYAKLRKANVSDVNYRLSFDLTQPVTFSGQVDVTFQLKDSFDLSLDFTGGEVLKLVVNGEEIKKANYNGFYIDIPRAYQKIGSNKVSVSFKNQYSNNGTGLYRTVDPLDQRVYIYSMFEPYRANKAFPCFDQPDLKATYTTEVMAPESWQVVSSNRESDRISKGQNQLWRFPQTEKFSTYTYSVHAGEYEVWIDSYQSKKVEIPLRLMARKSLAPFINTEEWFSLTKAGFDFFQSYFSSPFPYSKYDQLIVPDFNHGAMENVGAVTFSETRYVEKGAKTRNRKRALALTLFHEMAHMWFGNLVTMQWWDDLWLNEAFANLTSYIALANATEYKEAWMVFNRWQKQSAYDLDQSITTHPIMMEVKDTSEAFASFDSITYGKGAAALRQLSFLVGEKTFQKALSKYFKEFATKNATTQDFLNSIASASNKDLAQWSTRWLGTASVNQIEVNFTCRSGRINNFEIYQTGTQKHPFLRSHKTKVALYRRSGSMYKLNSVETIQYQSGRTYIKKMIGKLCPHIVYPNYDDLDYVVISLDSKSMKTLSANLALLQDSEVRGQIWSDLWRMVQAQKLDAERFLEIVEFNGLSETDLVSLEKINHFVATIIKRYLPRQGIPWAERRQVWLKFFEQFYISQIQQSSDEVEKQKLWLQNLIDLAESEEVLQEMETLLRGRQNSLPLAFDMTQDQRWQVVAKLVEFDHPNAMERLDDEEKRDPSQRGQNEAQFVRALVPDIEVKKQLFSQVSRRNQDKTYGELLPILKGLFPVSQQTLQKQFVEDIFSSFRRLVKSTDVYFARTFVEQLTPRFCDKKSSTRIQNFMRASKGLPFSIRKTLKAVLYENDQCHEIRKMLKNQKPQGGVNVVD